MSRFFYVDFLPEQGELLEPSQKLLSHLKSLRLSKDDNILLITEDGIGRLATWDGKKSLLIGKNQALLKPNPPKIHLFSAWPKGSRGDELIRRATESGAYSITQTVFQRSITQHKTFSQQKVTRYKKIMREVAQQCQRHELPKLKTHAITVSELQKICAKMQTLLLTPGVAPIGAIYKPKKETALIIGPEGGISKAEQQELINYGALTASINSAILRIESAGPTAIAITRHFHKIQGQ
jgi:16S rRNA (uracil1498-N3)-methyltransferase